MKTNQITKLQRGHDRPGSFHAAIASGLTGTLLLVTAAQAADAITSKVDVTQPTKQFTGEEWRAISLSASRVLKHVDSALDALANKKNDDASANIEKGLTLVKLINGVLPPTTVKTEITGAGVTYHDQDQIKSAFVPIYREYDAVDVLLPVAEQKQASAAAKSTSGAAIAPKTAPEVAYAGTDYSDIKLDLRLAKRDLLAAQDSIKSGDSAAAKQALQDIEASGVIYEFSTMRQPLARAMDNLRLAESELQNNHPDQARVALDATKDALKNYEMIAGSSRAKEVEKMQSEIDEVARTISQQKAVSFSKKVSGWWDKCLEWLS